MASPRPARCSAWAVNFALFASGFLALSVPYLLDKGYWIADAEVIVIAAAALVLALVVGVVGTFSRIVSRLSIAVVISLLVDLYFTNGAWVAGLGFALALGLAFSRLEGNLRWMVGAFSAVFLTTALVAPSKRPLTPALDNFERGSVAAGALLPPVIHLILDEHAAPTALPSSAMPSTMSSRLLKDYVDRGFVVYPSTRSTSGSTQISLGRLFSLSESESPEGNNFSIPDNGFSFEIRENRHIDALISRGYEVQVIQSNYLRLCDPRRSHCHTYSRADHGHEMSRFDGRLVDRLRLVLAEFHLDASRDDTVHSLALYRQFARKARGWPSRRNYWTRPAAMLGIMDELERYLGDAPLRGRAHIAHIMLPHFPYVLDQRCDLKPREAWVVPEWTSSVANQKTDPEVVLRAYTAQLACVHERALRLVDAVLRNPEGRDAIIVIHGDHGVRLSSNGRTPSRADIDADGPQPALDVMFAVRAPGLSPGVDAAPELLQRRFPTSMRQALGDRDVPTGR